MDRTGKYSLNDRCDWCGQKPAQPYVIEKRGNQSKRIKIEVMACADCARRMQLVDP